MCWISIIKSFYYLLIQYSNNKLQLQIYDIIKT